MDVAPASAAISASAMVEALKLVMPDSTKNCITLGILLVLIWGINLWVSLSTCGGDTSAPGMEILADQHKRIHDTGTRGAMFDWIVGPELVDELAQDTPVLTPEFAPGDAIFFDHQFGALCHVDLTAGYSDAFVEAVEGMYRELIDILERNGIHSPGH